MPSMRRGRPPHHDILTPSEWQVLEGVRAGRTNQEIAERLGVTFHTVNFHVSNMLDKLQLRDRQQLADWRPVSAEPGGDAAERVPDARLAIPWGSLKFVGATVAGMAVIGVAAMIAVTGMGGGDHHQVAPLPTSTRTPRPSATPTPACLRPITLPAGNSELRILVRGNGFTRLQFQVELFEPAPLGVGMRILPLRLSITASTSAATVPLVARPASALVGETSLALFFDTDPLPPDTRAVAVEVAGFEFESLATRCVEAEIPSPFRAVAALDQAPAPAVDLSERAPARIDTGYGWSYVIDGLDLVDNLLWVTYHAEGEALTGLVGDFVDDDPFTTPLYGLIFNGRSTYTQDLVVPPGTTSITFSFGGARRLADRSQPPEDAPLESGDWNITIPLD